MRRAPLVLIALACAVAAIAWLAARGSGGSTYHVDVVFDDARGLVPGQLLEIAGGRAGTIQAVTLTDGYRRARVALDVDARFAPFRASATCTIRPQGLIAENYVACNPGASGPPLGGPHGQAPTVPVTQTTEPVTLTDLFNMWNVPTRDRLGMLLAELGVASAGRGDDINAILRRANPSLALARRTISILLSQRDQLAAALDATRPVVAQLAAHRAQVRGFVAQSARVTTIVAEHRGALEAAVARLPALLSATRPALAQLDAVATQGTPVLEQLQASSPLVIALSADLVPLVDASRPALVKLGGALRRGAAVAPTLVPLTAGLGNYARRSLPTAQLTAQLFANLEQTGFFDQYLGFSYHAAAATARFDGISHILPAHVSFSGCSNYATAPVAGCATSPGASAAGASEQKARGAAVQALLGYLLR